MEVLAEDHRRNRLIMDFVQATQESDEHAKSEPASDDPLLTSGKRVAHRRYLTHSDAAGGTIFQRQAAAQAQRLEHAVRHVFHHKQVPHSEGGE